MTYTPYIAKDDPIEGCPRITEEEFQSLKRAGESLAEAKRYFKNIHDEILSRYKDPSIEERYPDGNPKIFWMLEGHNIKKITAIY